MKNIRLAELIPLRFQDRLIISMDDRWLDYFDKKDFKFTLSIQNENLVLVGPKVKSRPTKMKHPINNEEIVS